MYGGMKQATSLASHVAINLSASEAMPQRSSKIGRPRATG